MAELLINGKDAYVEWGVRMGNGFLDALNGYDTLKEYITNNDRTKDGVSYVDITPKVDERKLVLNFTMEGISTDDFRTKNNAFKKLLRTGDINIQVPADSSDIYHLKYTGQNCTFARNIKRTFAKIGLAFREPNPSDRT